MKRLLPLSLLLVFVGGCGGGSATDEPLEITFNNNKAYLLPATTQSCTSLANAGSADVAERYFTFVNPTITWNSDDGYSAQIVSIKAKFTGSQIPGGEFTCTIAGDEMGYLFGTPNGSTEPPFIDQWNGVLVAGGSKSANTTCLSMKCGGMVPVNDVYFEASGTVTITAIVDQGDGTSVSAKGSTTVTIVNDP